MQKKAEKEKLVGLEVDLDKVKIPKKYQWEIEKSMKILEAFEKIRKLEIIAENGLDGELIIKIKMDVKMGLALRTIFIPADQWSYEEELK